MKEKKQSISEKIAGEIKSRIASGVYAPGQQLPRELEFARELGISRASLREALSLLERQGLVHRKHGVGSFITDRDRQVLSSFDTPESMMNMVRRSGYEPSLKLLSHETCELDEYSASILEVPVGTSGCCIRTVYLANSIPFVYTLEYTLSSSLEQPIAVPREACEDLAEFLLKNSSKVPVETLTKLKGILADEELTGILQVAEGSPLLRQRFTLFDKDKHPLGCGYDFFNSSWFEFAVYHHSIRV